MVHINTKSVFGKLDIDDVASVRRVIVAVDYILSDSVIELDAEETSSLQGEEMGVTQALRTMVRDQQLQRNTLPLRATLHFVEARNGSDEDVLSAAREFEELADFEVLTAPAVYEEKYAAAKAKFKRGAAAVPDTYMRGHQTLFQRAPGAFGNQGFSSLEGARLEQYRRKLNPTWYPSKPTPPRPLNAYPCERCTRLEENCTQEEPQCWKCRGGNRECKYPAPGAAKGAPRIQTPTVLEDFLRRMAQPKEPQRGKDITAQTEEDDEKAYAKKGRRKGKKIAAEAESSVQGNYEGGGEDENSGDDFGPRYQKVYSANDNPLDDNGNLIPEDKYPDGDQGEYPSGDELSTPPASEIAVEDGERISVQEAYAEEERQIALVTGLR